MRHLLRFRLLALLWIALPAPARAYDILSGCNDLTGSAELAQLDGGLKKLDAAVKKLPADMQTFTGEVNRCTSTPSSCSAASCKQNGQMLDKRIDDIRTNLNTAVQKAKSLIPAIAKLKYDSCALDLNTKAQQLEKTADPYDAQIKALAPKCTGSVR